MAKRKKRSDGKKSRPTDAPKSASHNEPSAVAPMDPPQRHWPLLIGSVAIFTAWLVVLVLLVWQRLQG